MALINQHPAMQPATGKSAIREFPINDSSFLMAVKYDPNTLQCDVTLKNGGQYIYYMIFPGVIDNWMQAPSKGKFFSTSIRGKFKSARIVNKTVGHPEEGRNGKHKHRNASGRNHAG